MQAEAGASLISSSTDSRPPSRDGRAGSRRVAAVATVLLLGAVVWGLDRLTKTWALAELVPGRRVPLLGDVLQLNLLFNPGAAFSLGTGITPVFTTIQFVVAVACVVAAWWVGSRGWAIALGLVLGGASGNLVDRLTRAPGFGFGHVVDFLELPHWPVFNIADAAICTAAVLIAVTAFRGIGFDGSREGADDASTHGDGHRSSPETVPGEDRR